MTTVSFDNRFNVAGTRDIVKNSDNSLFNHQLTNHVRGWSGSQETYGHPYPYTTGGPWSLTRTKIQRAMVSGVLNPYIAGYRAVYAQFPDIASVSSTVVPILFGSRSINDVLADTNPSRPHIDLPYFFGELRELPELLYHYGKSKLRNAANANLTSEFGWELLVSDLKSMLDFQAAVDRRAEHLSRGFRNGGFRFRRELAKGSYLAAPVTVANSGPITGMTYRQSGSTRKWCSVSWVPDEDVRQGIPTPSEIRRRAFLACIGGRVDASTVWNLLPWSWLIDWFGDVGSFLLSRRNMVGFHPGQNYEMQHTLLVTNHEVTTNVAFSGTVEPPSYMKETKTRTVPAAISLSASVPILSLSQAGILGSLAVLKLL